MNSGQQIFYDGCWVCSPVLRGDQGWRVDRARHGHTRTLELGGSEKGLGGVGKELTLEERTLKLGLRR